MDTFEATSRKDAVRRWTIFVLLAVLLAASMLISVRAGSVIVPARSIFRIVFFLGFQRGDVLFFGFLYA